MKGKVFITIPDTLKRAETYRQDAATSQTPCFLVNLDETTRIDPDMRHLVASFALKKVYDVKLTTIARARAKST